MDRTWSAPKTGTARVLLPLVLGVGIAVALVALLAGRAFAQERATFDLVGTVAGERGEALAGAFVSSATTRSAGKAPSPRERRSRCV